MISKIQENTSWWAAVEVVAVAAVLLLDEIKELRLVGNEGRGKHKSKWSSVFIEWISIESSLASFIPPHCITKCQLKLIIIHSTTVLTVGLNNINLHAKIFNWVHTHFKQDAATIFASDVGEMFYQFFFLLPIWIIQWILAMQSMFHSWSQSKL